MTEISSFGDASAVVCLCACTASEQQWSLDAVDCTHGLVDTDGLLNKAGAAGAEDPDNARDRDKRLPGPTSNEETVLTTVP